MRLRSETFVCFFVFAAAFLIGTDVAAETDTSDLMPLSIHTKAGVKSFQVELADTPETRQRGLMFREKLASDRGMLFDYHKPRMVFMWMKNTLIPLDMLFLSETGIIVTIETNTVPHSLETISSKIPVRAVLELKAGIVEKFDIQVGDRVSHKIF